MNVVVRRGGVKLALVPPCRLERMSADVVRVARFTPEGAFGAELVLAGPVVVKLAKNTARLEDLLLVEEHVVEAQGDPAVAPGVLGFTIETALFTSCWPEGTSIVAMPDAPSLLDLAGPERSLLFVRGPLPREGRPALGEKLEEGETLIDVATDGDHERARIAFQRDGKPWVADQRVVPLTSLACVLVVAQAPEAHAKAFTAATDALVASIASRTA